MRISILLSLYNPEKKNQKYRKINKLIFYKKIKII